MIAIGTLLHAKRVRYLYRDRWRSGEFRELQLTWPRGRPILGAAARRRATASAGWWEAEPETLGLNLKQALGVGKTRKAMSTEAPESETGRCRFFSGRPGSG
jgi:hypothetical protein